MPLVLDLSVFGPGRVSFDVIDTSNLADHVGIIHMLPATVPLLSCNFLSVLYIETLLLASEDPSNSLSTMLCSDVSTMSLLLGLSPIGHLLGVTTEFTGFEALGSAILGQAQGPQQ